MLDDKISCLVVGLTLVMTVISFVITSWLSVQLRISSNISKCSKIVTYGIYWSFCVNMAAFLYFQIMCIRVIRPVVSTPNNNNYEINYFLIIILCTIIQSIFPFWHVYITRTVFYEVGYQFAVSSNCCITIILMALILLIIQLFYKWLD